MKIAAGELRFEEAAKIRDQIASLRGMPGAMKQAPRSKSRAVSRRKRSTSLPLGDNCTSCTPAAVVPPGRHHSSKPCSW